MGQAKNRAAEIQALKNTPRLLNVLAVRHGANGVKEFVSFGFDANAKPKNSKNSLLPKICLNVWGHSAPVAYIAEYLLQTDTYKAASVLNLTAFELNFYEKDVDPQGRETFSCRGIQAFGNNDIWQAHVDSCVSALQANDQLEVKTY